MKESLSLRRKAIAGVWLAVGCLTSAVAPTSYAALVVAPGGQAGVEGNAGNAFPFNSIGRMQQVYAASEFSAITGPTLITQIAFRPNVGFGGEAFPLLLSAGFRSISRRRQKPLTR